MAAGRRGAGGLSAWPLGAAEGSAEPLGGHPAQRGATHVAFASVRADPGITRRALEKGCCPLLGAEGGDGKQWGADTARLEAGSGGGGRGERTWQPPFSKPLLPLLHSREKLLPVQALVLHSQCPHPCPGRLRPHSPSLMALERKERGEGRARAQAGGSGPGETRAVKTLGQGPRRLHGYPGPPAPLQLGEGLLRSQPLPREGFRFFAGEKTLHFGGISMRGGRGELGLGTGRLLQKASSPTPA